MEKLFDDTLLVPNKRPTEITPQQQEELLLKLAKRVIDNQHSESDEETIAEDLSNLYINDSGFEKAKDLENNGNGEYVYEGDFIDFLDNMPYEYQSVIEDNVKLWVKAYNPPAKYEKGTKLTITGFLNRKLSKDVPVYITGIQEDTANYLVSDDKDRQGGYIITYETLEKNCEIAQ